MSQIEPAGNAVEHEKERRQRRKFTTRQSCNAVMQNNRIEKRLHNFIDLNILFSIESRYNRFRWCLFCSTSFYPRIISGLFDDVLSTVCCFNEPLVKRSRHFLASSSSSPPPSRERSHSSIGDRVELDRCRHLQYRHRRIFPRLRQ